MSRRRTLGFAVLLVSAPALLAFGEAASFYAKNATNGVIVSSGEKRDYLLYVPKTYDRRKPTPLVISMPGAGLWSAAQMHTSRWNRIADRENFIVVYPEGAAGDGPRVLHVEDGPLMVKDVRYISDLIDTLSAHYNIDRGRVYANGLSNGGGMSFVLSCTLRDRIAAVGLVASAQTLPFDWCPDARPLPVIAFHGTADPVTPFHGGTSWAAPRPFPDITRFVSAWSRRNLCRTSTDSAVAADVVRRSYEGCSADVVFYIVRGGGHTWPGGEPLPQWMVGRTATSIHASELMWQFFRTKRVAPPARN